MKQAEGYNKSKELKLQKTENTGKFIHKQVAIACFQNEQTLIIKREYTNHWKFNLG